MNNLLKLSKEFKTKSAPAPGYLSLPPSAVVTSSRMIELAQNLKSFLFSWDDKGLIENVLISVEYHMIVAKSNRVHALLMDGRKPSEESIVGARYSEEDSLHHIITHYVSRVAIESSIELLEKAAFLLDKLHNGSADKEFVDQLWKSYTRESWNKATDKEIGRTKFVEVLRDAHYVKRFTGSNLTHTICKQQVVTLYKTEHETRDILAKIGIRVPEGNVLDNSVSLNRIEYAELLDKAPFLVAMSTDDISCYKELILQEPEEDERVYTLPKPNNQPCIGVIDTPFDTRFPPYFSDWVEYHPMLPDGIEPRQKDFEHGTCVSSLVVDGGRLNPWLDDGCGNFQVRHFGVATSGKFSSFDVARKIEKIVSGNRDIKVWNLSLGSELEVEQNFISPEAAILDRLQSQYGVLFVVAGTNDSTHSMAQKIGAPADSINALVVNSVRKDKTPASYTRQGPVLHFHKKPDVSYYGGDSNQMLCLCCGTGEVYSSGTSLAAPLVARKAAFLIHTMGLSCEAAKALLIDSARTWNSQPNDKIGFGVIPIRIEDVLETPSDEIKFVVNCVASEYETYDYTLPVPVVNAAHPYIAQATLCYSPECNRNQGVDYTNTELDLHFGRLKNGRIQSIKENHQGEENASTCEFDARAKLRKWDNVKCISEKLTPRIKPRKSYENPLWAIIIRKTSRFQRGSRKSQRFALVITLKEITGANRFDSFVQLCSARGWTVNELKIENGVAVYEDSQVEIEWADEEATKQH